MIKCTNCENEYPYKYKDDFDFEEINNYCPKCGLYHNENNIDCKKLNQYLIVQKVIKEGLILSAVKFTKTSDDSIRFHDDTGYVLYTVIDKKIQRETNIE